MNLRTLFLSGMLALSLTAGADGWKGRPVDFSHGRIVVSENHRFLQHEDGTPFFYLGDTAWELFHRLSREEADTYLSDRVSKGFTVIQAVAIAELDGHTVPNAYGHLPLNDFDPASPAVADGPDNDYWDHVDHIVARANALGMYVGMLPTWGRYWHEGAGVRDNRPLFDERNAEIYGEFLGRRYKDSRVIWILGGDRNVDNDSQKAVIRAMARGLQRGHGGTQLMTFHPIGGQGSSTWFHNDDWLSFNMRQNGHNSDYTGCYSNTLEDYRRTPVKPVIDGEPLYEDHPLSFDASRLGYSISSDVRRPLYWDLFNGACGHTYGHHSVWQMFDPDKGRHPINNPLCTWREALGRPGSGQMMHARRLIESRPYFSRVPDPSLIVSARVAQSVPGEGRYRLVATRDTAGTYAMVYVPSGRRFAVNTSQLRGKRLKAWWFNPRDGKATAIGTFDNDGNPLTVAPPTDGELTDWVLVLDDVSCRYPAPGSRRWKGDWSR